MINKEGLAMIVWTISKVEYARLKRRKIETVFTGGDIISDGSVALLRPVDKRLNPTARVAEFSLAMPYIRHEKALAPTLTNKETE